MLRVFKLPNSTMFSICQLGHLSLQGSLRAFPSSSTETLSPLAPNPTPHNLFPLCLGNQSSSCFLTDESILDSLYKQNHNMWTLLASLGTTVFVRSIYVVVKIIFTLYLYQSLVTPTFGLSE